MSLQADLADILTAAVREFIRDNPEIDMQTVEFAVQDTLSDVQVTFWLDQE